MGTLWAIGQAEPTPDGGLKLYTQGQGIFDDRRQVADFLGIERDRLEVKLVPNGGAFGGKEDMSIQAQTALLARMTGRPVKLTLNREESIRLHPKRHPIEMDYTVGCDADGRITAVKARMVGDSGAYASVGSKVKYSFIAAYTVGSFTPSSFRSTSTSRITCSAAVRRSFLPAASTTPRRVPTSNGLATKRQKPASLALASVFSSP